MKYLLPSAVFLLMISIGMSLKLGTLWQHQKRLKGWPWLRLLVATFIVPPLVVLIMHRLLPLGRGEAIGLLLLAVVPGAPLMSRNAAKKGFDLQLAASYQVWGALLIPVMIPVIIYAIAKLHDRDIWIPPRLLLAQIAENQFLPLIIGLALMYFATSFSRKMQPAITFLGNLLLVVVIVLLLWKMRAALAAITPWLVVAAAILAASSILAIRVLLRSGSEIDNTLALCNANRHIGLALLLSGDYLKVRDALPAIACYALIAPVAMVVFARIVRKQRTEAAPLHA
jgi:predicted Na+-dependent transporter